MAHAFNDRQGQGDLTQCSASGRMPQEHLGIPSSVRRCRGTILQILLALSSAQPPAGWSNLAHNQT
jgi:hypothetical protein